MMKPVENDYVFSMEIPVRDYELDAEGIVNNANYLHYFEVTRHCFCQQGGFSFKRMGEEGIVPVMSRIEADYKAPLRSGDTMVSKLWVEAQGARFVFHQDIFNKATGELVIRAVISIVCIEHGRLRRGNRLREVFKRYLK